VHRLNRWEGKGREGKGDCNTRNVNTMTVKNAVAYVDTVS
jgi:hypothetical protein